MSRCKFASGKPFEGGSPCLKQTTARKKSRLLSRSLAFISIFCVLALLFTSLTPVVFADEMVPAPGENQGEANGGNPEQPGQPEQPEQPEQPQQPEQPEQPEQPQQPEQPAQPEQPEQPAQPEQPEQPEQPNPENNFSDLNATLVIDEVVAGATEISGKIETEEALPPYDLILEIIDKDGVTHTAELKADPDATFINPEWKIGLPEDYPSLQAGDQITITIKIPETDWELSESAEVQSTQSGDSELDISDVNIPDAVGGAVKEPTVNHVSIGDKTVSGKITIGAGQRRAKKLDVIIHVTVNRLAGGTEVKTVNIPYNAKTSWEVTLASELVEGDKVTVQQEFEGEISKGVVLEVKKSLADQHKDKLKMPSGEIWIEHTNSNQINNDEQAEAIEMLKKANPDIANDFESVVFSIEGTDHAYYEVTYTDKSTSGKIEARDLKIKTVTETSAAPTIQKVQVTDGQIIVTFDKEIAAGTKFYFVNNFTDNEDNSFCEGGKCIVDKSTSREMSQAVTIDGTKVTFPINDDDLELGKKFGIIVKEPHKFRSCAKSEPVITTPKKVDVRDPHKLTDADKQAIDKAIRDANTVNGKSKLPDGTGFINDPAFIEFDKDGNVTIISPNDVEVDWDNDGNPVYQKNADGTYKLNDGAKVTKFPVKDLVKNLKPESPKIAVNTEDGKVTITPPAYEKAGDDTDLASYTITYKDASDAEKTVTLTRSVDTTTGKTTWSSDGATVDAATGVVTLEIKDLAVGATITATAKDNGGLEGDTDPLDSDTATKKLETATVSYDANKGTGEMDSKELNKGSKYTLLPNAFTAPDDTQEFKCWKIGETEYKAGAEITVNDNTTVKAIWQAKAVETVKVTYDGNGGKGTMEGKTVDKGSKYTVLPNAFTAPDDTQEFKAWEVNGQEVAPGTEITVNDNTVVKAVWKKIQVKVTYDGNGGKGTMEGKTVDKGSKYTVLPNAFTAPDDTQEFKAWEVNGQEVAPGTEITVNDNTVVKAVWKKIQVNVTYDGNGGKGTMEGKTVDKGSTYTVLPNAFTAPDDTQEFKAWEVNGQEVAPGTEITVNDNTVVKALWKDIMVKIIFDPNGGTWSEGGTEKKIEEVKKGTEIDIIEAPTREGYKFLYWKGSEYQPGDKYTAIDPVHTFVAQWEPSPGVPPVIGRINPRDIPPKYVVTPQGSMQPAPSASTPRVYKTLPRTGESNGLPLLASALLALLGGALILSRKRS